MRTKDKTHENMSKFVNQYGDENACNPKNEITEAQLDRGPTQDRAHDPEPWMNPDFHAKKAEIQIVVCLFGFKKHAVDLHKKILNSGLSSYIKTRGGFPDSLKVHQTIELHSFP